MSEISVQQLFNYERFPKTRVNVLTLVLYFPFGFVLFLVRLIFLLLPVYVASLLFNDSPFIEQILRRLLHIALGISSKFEKDNKLNKGAVYISNYVSPFDHLVLISEAQCQTIGKRKLRPLPARVFGTNGPVINPNNLESTKKEINDYFTYEQNGSLLIQPEGKMTNGKALLKFKLWPFQVCAKVFPVVIKINRPLINLSVSTITSNLWSDAFYYMFSLKTEYEVKFLPPVDKKSMTDEEFSIEVRKQMATALKVDLVNYSSNDLEEYEKRFLADLERKATHQYHSSNANVGPQPSLYMQTMAQQVKDVLPFVPLKVIYKDLAKTKNVDLTVANILDGNVPYVPESPSFSPSKDTTSSTPSTSAPSTSKDNMWSSQTGTTPSQFGKSAVERMKSFQERKALLIENARRKYIEKHGLQGEIND